jgi:hypothetical protein
MVGLPGYINTKDAKTFYFLAPEDLAKLCSKVRGESPLLKSSAHKANIHVFGAEMGWRNWMRLPNKVLLAS